MLNQTHTHISKTVGAEKYLPNQDSAEIESCFWAAGEKQDERLNTGEHLSLH